MSNLLEEQLIGEECRCLTSFRVQKADGVPIFYREAGHVDAPVVLLLHGFPGSSDIFGN